MQVILSTCNKHIYTYFPCFNSCTINGDNKKSNHNLICNAPIFFYSPFNGSGGFCTTISRKSSSGATRISCFLLLILKYVNSLAGSRSLTMDLALSQRCEISTEYWKKKKNRKIILLK